MFGAKAIDDDDGENSRIVYRLQGKDAERFAIDFNNGVIRATQELANDQTTYQLQIQASDCGSEPQHVTADLMIHLWERQLFPSFRSSVGTRFTLPEDVPEGKVITKLSATTPKSGPISNLIYGIAGGNVGDALRIDPHTGEVIEIGRLVLLRRGNLNSPRTEILRHMLHRLLIFYAVIKNLRIYKKNTRIIYNQNI